MSRSAWRGLLAAGSAGAACAGLSYAYKNPEIVGFNAAESSPPPVTTEIIVPETTVVMSPLPSPETVYAVSLPAKETGKEQFDYDEVFIGSEGYAWPIGRPHRLLYLTGVDFTFPCGTPDQCHHDATPAFDIAYKDAGSHNPLRPENADVIGEDDIVGEPVRAILSGVIEVDNYQDVSGCQRIQLHSDAGPYFWYGHLENAIVGNGQTIEVEAGQQIATVGRWDCVGSYQSPRSYSHAHIDMGCTTDEGPQRGGSDYCRDEAFIGIINRLYAELPE